MQCEEIRMSQVYPAIGELYEYDQDSKADLQVY